MNAIHILFASIFGLGLVCGVAMAVANKLVAGMIDEELRTRVDRLAGVFLALALRRLRPDQRASYKLDWEGVLLVGLYDETAGLPVTRLFKSIWFGLSLWLGAGRIREEHKGSQQVAASGEKPAAMVIESGVGPDRLVDFMYTTDSGRVVSFQVKNSSDKFLELGNLRLLRHDHLVAIENGGDAALRNVRLGFGPAAE